MTTETFVRDPRVVAAANAIAGVDSGRRHVKAPTAVASAADYHEAVVAVKAVDKVEASGLAAVLTLHAPVRRYKACFTDTVTYPTAERALLQNRRDPLRGYESVVLAGVDDVPFVEVCKECSRVENAFEQHGYGYPDNHDDEQDGTELSANASAWPCPTYQAVNASGRPTPGSLALKAIGEVVDRWVSGGFVDRGAYEGIVWIEPLWPLPSGLDEIREALKPVAP